MQFTDLAPFGAEVSLDLSGAVDLATHAAVRRLLFERGLLVFRNQDLDHVRQVDVMGWFGKVQAPERLNIVSTDPETGWGGTGELKFHSDLAFSPHPCKVMSLHALEVLDGETSTLFASGVTAYAALPAPVQARLAKAKSHMIMPSDYADVTADALPSTDHPVVMTHPETGTPLLYVNEMQTERLVGVDAEESAALMAAAFERLYDPAAIYEHRWNRGDLVIWDNIALQHARSTLPVRNRRTLRRVIVADKLFEEMFPGVRAQA
jgi:taurine dioxygenase